MVRQQAAVGVDVPVAKKGSSSSSGASGSGEPPRRDFPTHCPQAEAKMYLPLDAHIWLSNKSCALNVHVAGCKRISEPFANHGGSQAALHRVLQRAWDQHLEKFALPRSECVVRGLF